MIVWENEKHVGTRARRASVYTVFIPFIKLTRSKYVKRVNIKIMTFSLVSLCMGMILKKKCKQCFFHNVIKVETISLLLRIVHVRVLWCIRER